MPEPIGKESDEEIARAVQSGKIEPFGILVQRYEQKMKRYARKFLSGYSDIEDIVQEIFLKAYANIQSFDASRKFSSWLYRIAHNEFVNAIKKRGKEPLPFFDSDILFPHPLSKDDPARQANEKELKEVLNKCISEISPKYREPLVLYYFEGFSYKEIADILRIPINTVGIRLQRGKKFMKKLCQKLNYNL